MDDTKRKCNTCRKELEENEYEHFGEYNIERKIWCKKCWIELQEYLKRKWFEEKIPELNSSAKYLLKECEIHKEKFNNIIKQTKKYLTMLREYGNDFEPSSLNSLTEQDKLTKFNIL